MSTERLPATRQDLPALQRLMQKRGTEEVGPLELDVWHGILLDEIAGRLDELGEAAMAIGSLIQKMEAQQERIPQGRMRPFTKSITGDTVEVWEVYEEDVVGRPCTSASIYSDGPDSVWVALEDLRDGFQEIKEGESLDFSFKHPIIKRFFFKSTAGGTANLRIALEY
jgi:hypothetical protein